MTGNSVVIKSIEKTEQTAAANLLFASQPESSRVHSIRQFTTLLSNDKAAAAGLFGAWRDGKLVSATWVSYQAGMSAIVSFPGFVGPTDPDIALHLLLALDEHLGRKGITTAQILLSEESSTDAHIASLAGYQDQVSLLYLGVERSSLPAAVPATNLEFESYSESQRQRLAELVKSTYIDSQDCPVLNGKRSLDDIISGYQSTGNYRPDRWYFVRHRDDDIGCVLLTTHENETITELVYMGISPAGRGEGWGTEIAEWAQWCAFQQGSKRLVLAVDASNSPALTTYSKAGFTAWEKRSAVLKFF